MSIQTDFSPKTDVAIQVRVCGHDVQSKYFDEMSTAFPTPKGIMLETVHQLCEGTTLEITQTVTHRKAIAQVKSLGPKLGVSTLVFVEGVGVEYLWLKESPEEVERRKSDVTVSETSSSFEAMNTGALVAMPERRLLQVSKLRIPTLDRFMESFSDLVESALKENLGPTVEQLTNEIPEHVVKARSAVFAKFEEQLETAFSTFGDRLDARTLQIVTRSEHVLTQKVRELMEETHRHVKSQREKFNQNLEEELLSGRERLHNEVDGVVSEGCAQLRDKIQNESGDLERQVVERCQSLTEETQNILSGRAQQVEADLAERFSQKITGLLDDFSAELEKRFEQPLAMHMAGIDRRLEETVSVLSGRARQVEREVAGRLDQQAYETAERFRAELHKYFEQDLIGYGAQFQEQLALSASQIRSQFMEQMEGELNQKQEKLVQEAQRLVKDVTDQNHKQVAWLLRELAQVIEHQAEPSSETAIAAD